MTDTHRHGFLCGLHRSGKSWLYRLLQDQPGVGGLGHGAGRSDEGQHLQAVIAPARDFGGPGRFAFDPRAVMTSADASADRIAALRNAWAPHWSPGAAWRWEQSPPNVVRASFLEAVYPRAKFVFVVRHPVAVAMATRSYDRFASLESLIRHWVFAHDIARSQASTLQDAQWVSYEALVSTPRPVVRRCLELDDGAPVHVRDDLRSNANDEFLERWSDWMRSAVRRHWMRGMIARLEPSVRSHGYSLVDLDRTPAA